GAKGLTRSQEEGSAAANPRWVRLTVICWGVEGGASSPLVEAPKAPDRRSSRRPQSAQLERINGSMRRSPPVAGQAAVEYRREVPRVHRLGHVQTTLRPLEGELDHVGRVVRGKRLGERLHGVGVVAHLDQAVAHLEPGL